MWLMHAGLLFLLFWSTYCDQFRSRARSGVFVQDPELEWERMATVIDEVTEAPVVKDKRWGSTLDSGLSMIEPRRFPEFRAVLISNDQREVFKPEKGARPLPEQVKKILLISPSTTPAPGGATTKPKLVEILCHVDRIYVRVRREVFKSRDAYKYLKLGICPVNHGTKDHYYLMYLLKTDCGFKKERNADHLSISNLLRYKPTSPVLRDLPFDIPLQCKYPRWFHSYKVGFYPKLQGGTVFKALQPKSSFALTPQDASGNDISGTKTYNLGETMYFKASGPGSPASSGKRLYINKCFMTTSQDPNSNPKYTVINNQGCMVDGRVALQSKFLADDSKMVQKFSVSAFIFKGLGSTPSSQQLYMHCEISIGPLTPTQSSKACSYCPATRRWKELYGSDSVCTCCDSTCLDAQLKAPMTIISSHPWKVDLSSEDVEVDPQITPDGLEDPDMAQHRDFLSHWDPNY